MWLGSRTAGKKAEHRLSCRDVNLSDARAVTLISLITDLIFPSVSATAALINGEEISPFDGAH